MSLRIIYFLNTKIKIRCGNQNFQIKPPPASGEHASVIDLCLLHKFQFGLKNIKRIFNHLVNIYIFLYIPLGINGVMKAITSAEVKGSSNDSIAAVDDKVSPVSITPI
jgi:hypothetical protein